MADLGKRITSARTSVGIRQKVLAKTIGMSANFLSLVENGKRTPSLKTVRKIENALNLPEGGIGYVNPSSDTADRVLGYWCRIAEERRQRIKELEKHIRILEGEQDDGG